jgi:mRNA deadenylase 3'-5' endonuclease subunit Ccr4
MIVSEILAYKADIICLQEVDASIHNSLLSPVLRACGYQGYYSNKVNDFIGNEQTLSSATDHYFPISYLCR